MTRLSRSFRPGPEGLESRAVLSAGSVSGVAVIGTLHGTYTNRAPMFSPSASGKLAPLGAVKLTGSIVRSDVDFGVHGDLIAKGSKGTLNIHIDSTSAVVFNGDTTIEATVTGGTGRFSHEPPRGPGPCSSTPPASSPAATNRRPPHSASRSTSSRRENSHISPCFLNLLKNVLRGMPRSRAASLLTPPASASASVNRRRS